MIFYLDRLIETTSLCIFQIVELQRLWSCYEGSSIQKHQIYTDLLYEDNNITTLK